jgi:glycosyltransferase involved in cell wall biosynthesis
VEATKGLNEMNQNIERAEKPVTLTILVPVYNEEGTILNILQKVNENEIKGVTREILVVDDGSSDKTPTLLKEHPELYNKLICCPKNGGKGAAVKVGLKAATGDFVLFQDADLEYDPREHHKVLQPVLEFDADVVMGSRFLGPAYTRVHYFWNYIGNRVITLIFDSLYNMTFTDIYTCYFCFRRNLINPDKLRSTGFDQQAEILGKCVKHGKRFYEVPISYNGRTIEEGKKIRAHHVFGVIWMILRSWFGRNKVSPAADVAELNSDNKEAAN